MKIPRIRFIGDGYAEIMNSIFAENVRDLLDKVEVNNDNGIKGFLHTSTNIHERTCYYNQMWARDCGRGVIELARLGFIKEADAVCDYFLSHLSYNGTHWAREIHNPGILESTELDGNALILLSIYNTWYMSGKDESMGIRFLKGLEPVLAWCENEIENSNFHNLMGSRSELSGNPGTEYTVYGVFGNYCMHLAMKSLAKMQSYVNGNGIKLANLAAKLENGVKYLISDGKMSKTEKGCFMNAIDSRDFSAYDYMEFADQSCDAWHWTRQMIDILNPDADVCSSELYAEPFDKTYRFIKKYMASGYFFRKFGFVSNTGWTGIGGRHDDTMCGYGQGFFSQAALLADDVNCYGKCLEGIARLGYDGNVLEHLANENNPFVMHECFCYENYEQALDHTYGGQFGSDPLATENPGDEGNLVQGAEIVKALRIVAGVNFDDCGCLTISPKLPWLWNGIEVTDYPVINKFGKLDRISFTYKINRHLRNAEIEITQGYANFNNINVRFGPFAKYLNGVEREQRFDASWLTRKITSSKFAVSLDELQQKKYD